MLAALRTLELEHALVQDHAGAQQLLRRCLQRAVDLHSLSLEIAATTALAQLQFDVGETDQALQELESAMPRSSQPSVAEEAAVLRVVLAQIDGFRGQPEKAFELLDPVLGGSTDRSVRASALTRRAELRMATGKLKDAVADTNAALALEREGKLQTLEIDSLIVQGQIYTTGGNTTKALAALSSALPLAEALQDTRDGARIKNFMGEATWISGQGAKALALWNEALPLERQTQDRPDEGATLQDIGVYYAGLDDTPKAIAFYAQARAIFQGVHDLPNEAVTLNNLGNSYADIGDPQRALASYEQALQIEKATGGLFNQAVTLDTTAVEYEKISQFEKAREFYLQSLSIARQLQNANLEGKDLNNLGVLEERAKHYPQALAFFRQALDLHTQGKDQRALADTLHNLGRNYFDQGNIAEATAYYTRAIDVEQKANLRHAEAFTRWRLSQITPARLDGYLEAMQLAKQVDDPDLTGRIQSDLMLYYRDHNATPTAIFFGKQSINNFQRVRNNMTNLSASFQDSFATSRGDTYRELAQLLLRADRFPEAEQVLGLLKKQEYAEYSRGSGPGDATQPLGLTPAEEKANEATADEVTWLSLKALGSARTADQQAQFATLESRIGATNKAFSDSLRTLLEVKEAHRNVASETSGLQNVLRQLKTKSPGTVGIYTIVSANQVDIILVTANLRLPPRRVMIDREALTQKVVSMRRNLQDPCTDPRPAAEEIYKLLIPPILADLTGAGAKTIVWELDGVLRYIPMSALYDGSHYFAESYRNVIFSSSNQSALTESSAGGRWSGLGLGTSEAHGLLSPLPGVPVELQSIFLDPSKPKSIGPVPGHIHIDKDFTRDTFAKELQVGYPIVHVASHFVLKPGSDQSYLVLGSDDKGVPDSDRLTYADLRDGPSYSFDSVQLLTLSACQTGTSAASHPQDGAEVDALGDVAAARGAKAVLATLWSINDASTASFMTDFYKTWTTTASSKAAALQKAQVDMLHQTGVASGVGCKAQANHPFFWAPFVLIGNWQ